MKNICVYGASSDNIDQAYFGAAEEVGRFIALKGFGLVYGGGAFGLMGAAARGAKSAGGYVTGVAPEFFKPRGVLFEDCDEFFFTQTMRERKQKMEDLSCGFIVLPGGAGTYEEFFEMFTLRQLRRHSKPIAMLNTNGYYDAMAELLKSTVKRGFMKESALEIAPMFSEPKDAVDHVTCC